MISCTGTHLNQLTHWPLGIRDDEHSGYGRINYPSSTRSTPTMCAVFIIPQRHALITPVLFTATAYAIGELGADIIRNRVDF